MTQALTGAWEELNGKVSTQLTAVQARYAELSKPANRKMAQGIDLPAAKSAIDDAASAWSQGAGRICSREPG